MGLNQEFQYQCIGDNVTKMGIYVCMYMCICDFFFLK